VFSIVAEATAEPPNLRTPSAATGEREEEEGAVATPPVGPASLR
jgi:hypothetical protein